MQAQMHETTTAAPGEDAGAAGDPVAKPAASLSGNMLMRQSPAEAALASAKPTAAPAPAPAPAAPALASAKPTAEPGPAPVALDDATPPADRKEPLTHRARTAVAGLRALGSRLVPQPAIGGPRRGLGLPKWGAATAIFVFAYLIFVVAIVAGLTLLPELMLPV